MEWVEREALICSDVETDDMVGPLHVTDSNAISMLHAPEVPRCMATV